MTDLNEIIANAREQANVTPPVRRRGEHIRPRELFAGLMYDCLCESTLTANERVAVAGDVRDLVGGVLHAMDYARALRPHAESVPLTYFVRMRLPGRRDRWPLKIGTSDNLQRRLATLAGMGPYPVEFVASVPGVLLAERQLHAAFAEYRLRGEWFRESGRLRRFMRGVMAFTEAQGGSWENGDG